MSPIYRTAQPADAREIARLSEVLGYPLDPEETKLRLVGLLENPAHCVAVASVEGTRLLGWMHVEERCSLEGGTRAELLGLVVDSAARRQGIGGSLVAMAETWASERGLPRLVVRSNVARTTSHPFYEALGYVCQKTQDVYSRSLLPD